MRVLNRLLVGVSCVGLMVGSCCYGESRQANPDSSAGNTQSAGRAARENADARSNGSLVETIAFRFDIAGLKTDHQFEGQMNTFHVEYEYSGALEGADFDPQGHAVPANTFPYFQALRNDIIKFATEYPDKNDFYEIFGTKICRFVMRQYPQIRKMTLTIDVPAYKDVDVDRSETVVVVRRGAVRK